jgi:serine/threonine-protein kinase
MQNSKGVDLRTDLWSLGSTLYAVLAGRAPYRHVENLFELLPAVRAGSAPPLQELAPWVPARVAEVVGRALAVAPEDRYPSATAMREALLPLIDGDAALREERLVGRAPERRPAPFPRSTAAPASVNRSTSAKPKGTSVPAPPPAPASEPPGGGFY